MMTQESLRKLKNKLPRGSVKKIAHGAEVSVSTVRKVLDGERNNMKVIKVAIELALNSSQQNNDVLRDIEKL